MDVDVVILLDADGGAAYVVEACRAIADHPSNAVDAEVVTAEKMAEIVAPYVCYLGGSATRSV